MASLSQLYQALANPNARNFLNIIAKAEGVQHGYNTLFGNQRFNSLNAHPNIKKSFRQTNGKMNTTTAAGRYQFLNSTWNNLAKQYGFRSFSPQEQDLGALALIAQNGALKDVLSGNYVGAIKKLGGVWASLPSSTYAQPKKSYAQLGLAGPQRTQQQRQNNLMLVGVMGDYRLKDTGIGSGDHYDLRLARNADGSRGDVNPYLNRFIVDGRGLHTYKQTGRFNEQRNGYRHGGVDYGINGSFGGNANTRNLYIAPEWTNRVKNVRAFDDNKNGGGWVTQVEFDDGKKINILHQNQKGTQQVMSAYQGRQQFLPQVNRFLSPSQITQVLPQLNKNAQQQRFLSAEQARRVLPQLSAPQQPQRFLSQDEISKVLPQLAKK